MSFRFLHAADIHLDSPLHGLEAKGQDDAPLETLRGATRKALANMVDLALAEQVAFVLIAGDVFDGTWRDYSTGLVFLREMQRLAEADIPVYMVLGNHDAESRLPKDLRWPDSLHVFKSRKAETEDKRLAALQVAVHGQSFAQRDTFDNLALGFPSPRPGWFNIGLLHTAATGRPGHAAYAPCTPADLEGRGYDYWALGHVHEWELLSNDPPILFPGNLQGRHVRETGAKGCALVHVDDAGRVIDIRHHACDVVRWAQRSVDVSACATYDAVLTAATQAMAAVQTEAEGRLLALRLRLEGTSPLHGALLREEERLDRDLRFEALGLGSEALWLERLVLATRPAQDPQTLRARGDALGSLVESLDTLQADPETTQQLEASLGLLERNLPPELDPARQGPETPSQRAEAQAETPAAAEVAAEVEVAADPLSRWRNGDWPGLIAEARDLLLAHLSQGDEDADADAEDGPQAETAATASSAGSGKKEGAS